MEKGEPFSTVGGNAANVESSMEIPQKTKNGSAFYPALPLLGIYLKEPKTQSGKNVSIPVFIAALLIIAKIWKQPSVHQYMSR